MACGDDQPCASDVEPSPTSCAQARARPRFVALDGVRRRSTVRATSSRRLHPARRRGLDRASWRPMACGHDQPCASDVEPSPTSCAQARARPRFVALDGVRRRSTVRERRRAVAYILRVGRARPRFVALDGVGRRSTVRERRRAVAYILRVGAGSTALRGARWRAATINRARATSSRRLQGVGGEGGCERSSTRHRNSFVLQPASMTGLAPVFVQYRLQRKSRCNPFVDAPFREKSLPRC